MALSAPSVLTASGFSGTADTSNATVAISPTAGAILVAALFVGGATTTPSGLTVGATTLVGQGAWTSVIATADATNHCQVALFYSVCGGSPGSGTITFSQTNSANRWAWVVAQVTGQDPTSPVRQSQTAPPVATTTLSMALGSAPLASSLVIGALGSRLLTFAVGSGFTDAGSSPIGANCLAELEYALTGATTTVNWSGLGTTSNQGAAIEIIAPAATQVPYMPYGRQPFLAT